MNYAKYFESTPDDTAFEQLCDSDCSKKYSNFLRQRRALQY